LRLATLWLAAKRSHAGLVESRREVPVGARPEPRRSFDVVGPFAVVAGGMGLGALASHDAALGPDGILYVAFLAMVGVVSSFVGGFYGGALGRGLIGLVSALAGLAASFSAMAIAGHPLDPNPWWGGLAWAAWVTLGYAAGAYRAHRRRVRNRPSGTSGELRGL
jgi:hypothetical protein